MFQFTMLKPFIIDVHFLPNLSTMNILEPVFYRMLFLKFSPVPPPPSPERVTTLLGNNRNMTRTIQYDLIDMTGFYQNLLLVLVTCYLF